MTFAEAVRSGKAKLDDIDDWVDQWHTGPSAGPLNEWLGFTKAEYKRWVEDPDALQEIVGPNSPS